MTKLSPRALRHMRQRVLADLYVLVTQVLYPGDQRKYGELHRWMCATVGKAPGTRELWLLPRDHFKTTILTIAHCIQKLLNDPAFNFFMASSKDDHPMEWSSEIQRHFTQNARMRTLFAPWCASDSKQMGSVSTWTSPAREHFEQHRREPTCTTLSFKGRVESKHYRWGYLDDCMSEEDATEVGLKEAQDNFKKFIPLIDTDGGIIMPGTRKHYNDIYQHVMDTGAFKVYVRHGLEAADQPCDTDECSRFAQPHGSPNLKVGKPLCAERMDRKDYEDKLRLCEIDPKLGQSYFWHEYMNIPFSPSDRVFQQSWFHRIEDSNIPGQTHPFSALSKWIAVDTAWKDDEHPTGFDFTVIVVGGFDDNGFLYILDIFRKRDWTMKVGCEMIVTTMKSYGINRVITEKVGEVTWHPFLQDRCRVAGIPCIILPLTRGGRGSKSKVERIRGLQGYFEQKKVMFRKSCENYEDAINEFCNLGRWTNDDIADAISMFLDERVRIAPPPRAADINKQSSNYHPMPFDGAARAGRFQQHLHAKPSEAEDRNSADYIMKTNKDNIPLAQAWSGTFVPAGNKEPEAPKPAFRIYR